MPKFKDYNQNQPMLFPLDMRDLIDDPDHICFVIDQVVNSMDLSKIKNTYSDNGASAYSPAMMIKLLFFAYTNSQRSSRDIEKLAKEHIVYRFLTANQTPDHGTINLFRKNHLIELEDIFSQLVLLCDDLNIIDASEASIDGSIFRADASRENTLNKKKIKNIRKKIKHILRQAENADKKENKKYGAKYEMKGGKKQIKRHGKEQGQKVREEKSKFITIPKRLRDKETRDREIKRLIGRLKQLDKAEETIDVKQEKVKERPKHIRELSKNSNHNTTDRDANLMKLKTGKSYKPGYNVQIATSNQVIMGYEVSGKGGDVEELIPLIEKTEKITKRKIETLKADAGYFSKKNIESIKEKEIDSYIPDPAKSREERQERDNSIPEFDKRNFKYDEENDEYICPNNRRLLLRSTQKPKEYQGPKHYRCKDCSKCKSKANCTKDENRSIRIDQRLNKYKKEMREKLNTEEGKDKYTERMYDVEPVFGNITYNQKARRFLCRGKPMVKIEFGLSAIAHNFIKISNWIKRQDKNIEDIRLDSLTKLRTRKI